jgi:hypothetical protein
MTGVVPSGWTVAVSPGGSTLDPVATGQIALAVTSPQDAAAGSYPAVVTAIDGTNPAHSASVSASYTVTTPCVLSPPSISASPLNQEAMPAATLTYDLTVTNRDGSMCPATTFGTQLSLPAGWTGGLSSSVITVAPGQSGALRLSVNSAAAAVAGSYDITANVSDNAKAGHGSAVGMTYTVLRPPDTTAPTAPLGLIANVNQRQKQIDLSWNAATDNVGVIGYRVVRDGVVVALVVNTHWTDPSVLSGTTYTYYVVADDAAGNVSARSNSVSVTLSGGAKKR